MTPRYYAKRGDALLGPFENYSKALECHADAVSRQAVAPAHWTPPAGIPQILLDVTSFGILDERELAQMLHHDPVLKALFDLGRQYEWQHSKGKLA